MARKQKQAPTTATPRTADAPDLQAETLPTPAAEPAAEPARAEEQAPHWLPTALVATGLALVAAAQGVTGSAAPRFPVLSHAALVLAGLSLGCAALAAGLWRADATRKIASMALFAAAIAAFFGLRLRELADPALSTGWAEPLRDGLLGLTPAMAAAVAVGGLCALALDPESRAARALAGIGGLGLWLHAFLPVGWLGATVIPAFAGLTGIANPPAPATDIALPGGTFVVVEAVLATSLLAGLALARSLPRPALFGIAGALAALCVAWPLHAGMAGLGLAIQVAGAIALTAGSLALVLRVRRDDALPTLQVPTEAVAVAVLIAVWIVLKINGLRFSTTDEGLYFYAARLWSQGQLPYRDFFFSHPPLHIGIPALFYAVFGYHFIIGKLLSASAALIAGLAAWRIARTHIGIWAGVLTLGLYLTACEVLQASTNLTGINLTVAWMMLGVWATLSRRFFWGGLLLGAAASTGFYSLGTFLALFVLALAQPLPAGNQPRWQRLLQHPAALLGLGFLCVWGTLNVYFTIAAGDSYLQGVYAYHLAKKAKVVGYVPLSEGPQALVANFFTLLESRDFTVTLYYHSPHYFLAFLAPLGVALRVWLRGLRARAEQVQSLDKKRKADAPARTDWPLLYDPRRWWREPGLGGAVLIVWLATGALLVEFGQFKERYDFYYSLLIPGLAICAAAWLDAVLALGQAAIRGVRSDRAWQPPDALRWAAVGALALSLLWVSVNLAANRKAYASEFNQIEGSGGLGERLTFDWVEPPGPPWLGEVTRGLFWADTRLRGNIESGVHHYLWNKKRWFSKAEEIAAYIKQHSAPEDTVTGASDYAPLLALMADRRLAGNQVDTNSKVFNTGAVPLEKFWDKVCADHVKFLIVAPMSYFAPQTIQKRTTIVENFKQEKVFSDPMLRHWKNTDIELWVRKQEPPAKACEFKGARGAGPNLERD